MKKQVSDKEQSQSPYFLINSPVPDSASVSLLSTQIEAQIDGVIADVTVRQKYVNESRQTLEAVYVFAGSTRAAVYGLDMRIGEREIHAKVKEREAARKEYNRAKQEGKTAGLLEQHRPNVFQMNVANILPGDFVEVVLHYTELLEYRDRLYEFVYPGVVGPRYSTGGEEWVEQSTRQLDSAMEDFDITVAINAGVPVQSVQCSSHQTRMEHPDARHTVVTLANRHDKQSDRDFILQYGLQGEAMQSGFMCYRHDDAEQFFLLMAQPPRKALIEQVPPREFIFIVDVSASMYGFPLEISKAILRKLIASLRPTDIFNVLLFEFSRSMLSDCSLPATPRNIENALALISEQQGRGGTELYPALQTAFDFKTTPEFARTFIIITDGYVTIESKAFQLVQERRNQANLFALGIGNDVNRHLIEGLAYAGAGEAYFITNRTEAETVGEKLIQDIAMPLWSHIEVEWGGFDAYEVEPVPTPDLFADKPVILYGKYRGNPSDIIRLKGKTASGDFEQTIPVDKAEMTQSEALRYLWARNRIKYLSDYASYFEDGVSFRYRNETPRHQRQITDLGLKYNLLTKYTSFLAVDEKEEELNEIEDGVVVQAEEILYSIKAPSPIFARLKRSVDSFTVCLFDDEAEEPEMECSEPVISSCEAKKETKPSFPGGKKAFKKWLYKHLQYPSECALMSGVTVIVEFTVDETGSVSNVRIVRSIHPLLDAEAIRVISLSPNWFPGIRDGAPVKMEHTFPVVFKYKRKNLLKRFFKHEK